MSMWVYVAAGWLVTTGVIAAYWTWLAVRTRRASQELAQLKDAP